jgi:holo-[acyl-carrier protein] synthase
LSPGALLGVGLDLVDVDRFERVLDRRPGLAGRLFAREELDYAGTLARPGATLAGRFAAKEAVMKALGVGIGAVDWVDVAVLRKEGGAPQLVVRGRAARLAESRGVVSWQLSISHTGTVAAAVAVALS